MKLLNVWFENKDFEQLKKKKGELMWREFILTLLEAK